MSMESREKRRQIITRRNVELPDGRFGKNAPRNSGLGGTDAATIFAPAGVAFGSPMQVYAQKLNLIPSSPMNEAMYWGRELEDVVARRYAREHHVKLKEGPHYTMPIQHPEQPWRLASPDRFIMRNGRASRILEVKTASAQVAYKWGPAGSVEVPELYLYQCAWYAAFFNLPVDLAVLIGGSEYREYLLPRDKDLEAMIIEKARVFWHEHVLTQTPPEADETDATSKALARMYPRDTGTMLDSTQELDAYAIVLRDTTAKLAALQQTADDAANHIKRVIGEAAAQGVKGDWGYITWKQSLDRNKVDWKGVAHSLGIPIPRNVIDSNSTITAGSRRFLTRFKSVK